MGTFIEIHVLQNFAPSNLNRDDTGAPKDAIFGGSRRARVSSQCFKRAIRQSFGEMTKQGRLNEADLGVRTKRLLDALVTELSTLRGSDEDVRKKAEAAIEALGFKLKDGEKSEYLVFFGQREIRTLAQAVHQNWDILGGESSEQLDKKSSKTKSKSAKKAGAEDPVKKAFATILDGGKALDVALFGRMLADMPEKNQHAACQVAHAISTHTVEREFDFYTAIDDLKPEESAGADMMGTVEFNSACYYRYAVLHWEKLCENLQGDFDLARKGLGAFLESFIVSQPTGKQNTFAAHNPPEFISVFIRHELGPRNLCNAFEVAVRGDKGRSLLFESAKRLDEKAGSLDAFYGGSGTSGRSKARYLATDGEFKAKALGEKLANLHELVDWVSKEVPSQGGVA